MATCMSCHGSGVCGSGTGHRYYCPECDGSGSVPECEICGEPVYNEYCTRCQGVCVKCGEVFDRLDLVAGNYCPECYQEEFCKCANCGEESYREEADEWLTIDGEEYCPACVAILREAAK